MGIDTETGRELIGIDPRYFRPTEVEILVGDAAKARHVLGWAPRVRFTELVNMMADADLRAVQAGEPFSLDPALEPLRVVLS